NLSAARFEHSREAVIHAMRSFDSRVRNLEVWSPHGYGSNLYVDYEGLGLALLSSFGDGFRRILTVALQLPRAAGGELLVDEIETAIHYTALTKSFSWLVRTSRQHDTQVFATTHSLEAVDAMLAADEE